MTYRAVFFDAGETLVHPHPSFPELLADVLRREVFEIDPVDLHPGSTVVAEHFARAAEERLLWTTSPERSRAFWLGVYRTFLADLGIEGGDGLPERLYAEFTDLANYRLFTDVESVLRGLRERGLVLGVISNFEDWLERLLEAVGVATLFDVQVISGIEGVEKPDDAIFRIALERSGVAAAEAVYVGDNPALDTGPAEALGMLGVLIDRRGRYPDHPGIRITSMADLPTAIGLTDGVG